MPFVSARPLEEFIDERAPLRTVRRIADAGGDELQRLTKRHTPVGNRLDLNRRGRLPGTLRESIERSEVEPVVRAGAMGFRVRVLTRDPVFPYIEWNTRPHIIRPRHDRAPATVIATGRPRRMGDDPQAAVTWLEIGGRRVFAHEVHHPGTVGQHPFARAALEMDNSTSLRRVARPALERFEREIVRAA